MLVLMMTQKLNQACPLFFVSPVQEDAAGVGSVRSCSSVLSGVGLPD